MGIILYPCVYLIPQGILLLFAFTVFATGLRAVCEFTHIRYEVYYVGVRVEHVHRDLWKEVIANSSRFRLNSPLAIFKLFSLTANVSSSPLARTVMYLSFSPTRGPGCSLISEGYFTIPPSILQRQRRFLACSSWFFSFSYFLRYLTFGPGRPVLVPSSFCFFQNSSLKRP